MERIGNFATKGLMGYYLAIARCFTFILAFWMVLPVYAIEGNVKFQKVNDGLSNQNVKCILKDRKGFMWFGTSGGLNRFDGTQFYIFENDLDNTASLNNKSVNALLEDRQGDLWIGTNNGVCRYNREKNRFEPIEIFGEQDIMNIRTLLEDHLGRLWIGTFGNGLYRYDRKKNELINFVPRAGQSSSIGTKFIISLIQDTNQRIWVGTREGLYLFHPNDDSFEAISIFNQSSSNKAFYEICDMSIDQDGNLWIGTYGQGVVKLSYSEGKFHWIAYNKSNSPNSLSNNHVLAIMHDRKGNLWIGTENGGLNLKRKGSEQFEHFFSEDGNPLGIVSNSIWSLYEDDIGLLWIGTFNKGVCLINENYYKFDLYQRNCFINQTLVSNYVRAFAEDTKGNLWIATDGNGICYFDTKNRRFSEPINNNTLASKALLTVVCDHNQQLWVGTWGGGVDRYDAKGKKIRNYNIEGIPSYGRNNTMILFIDRHNVIWAGSSGSGLFYYQPSTDQFIRVIDDTNKTHLTVNSYVNAIFEDSEGLLWIGTSYGLACIERDAKGQFIFEGYDPTNQPNSINSYAINTIFEDSKQKLWIGTENGLNHYNRIEKNFTSYRKSDGLPNNIIKGILEDNQHCLWISTNKGISKFDPGTGIFKNFSKDDGLIANEFYANSCIKTSKGEFFFGGNEGFNAFYPDQIKLNDQIPPVYLTDFKLFNNPVEIGVKESPLEKSIEETVQITLKHNQNSFSIGYVAVNYTHSSKNQYTYFLEGFDKEWNYVGSRRMAHYTNLNPGKYVFRVKGSNNDGIWNEQPTSLKINIKKPYYKTIWAYIVIMAMVTGLFLFIFRLLIIQLTQAEKLKLEQVHSSRIEELGRIKINFFADISHELRNPLSLIIAPLEQLVDNTSIGEKAKDKLQLVYNNAQRLYTLLDELMDFTKSEEHNLKMAVAKGKLSITCHELYNHFSDEAYRRHIDYRFETSDDQMEVFFDKNKLEKIIINLLSNAFKYTPDNGCIKIKVDSTPISGIDGIQPEGEQYARIRVIDNGSGISPKYIDRVFDRFFQSPEKDSKMQTGSGIGLALVKSLVELHHGKVFVTSEKWKETCFTVLLPLGYEHYSPEDMLENSLTLNSNHLPVNGDKPILQGQGQIPLVLLVEDNEELRGYLSSELSFNYRIMEAADGAKGWELAIQNNPDLVISDIVMPILSGTELCHMIKGNLQTSHIPVVLLTSKSTTENKIDGIESGADAYITKPFNLGHLDVTVRKLIETRHKLYQRFSQDVYMMPKEMSCNELDQKFLKQAISYIEKNATEHEITVESLSAHLLMSRNNVYRKIKSLTGQAATEFIRTVKLKMTLKDFEEGKLSIAEIAFKAGFASPAYFAKCFKNQFGKLPSETIQKRSGKG